MPLSTAKPKETAAASALYVITHPEEFADQPAVRAIAWATQMEARGNSVNLDRMGIPALPALGSASGDLPLADDLSLRSPRVSSRIAARMAERNAKRGPFDGDAA